MIKLHWNKNLYLLNPLAINLIYPTEYGSRIKLTYADDFSHLLDCDETPDEILELIGDSNDGL